MGTVRAYTDAHGEVVKQYRFDSFGNYLNQDTFSLAASGGLFSGFDRRLGGFVQTLVRIHLHMQK